MATFVKKGNRILVRVRIANIPGESKSFEDMGEAEQWAFDTEARLRSGLGAPNPEKILVREHMEVHTLDAGLNRYKDTVTVKKKGAKQEANRIELIQRKYPRLCAKNMVDITRADLRNFRDSLIFQGYKAATVIHYMTVIANVLKKAKKEWGYERIDNPFEIEKPSINNSRDRRMSNEEWQRFLRACDQHRNGWLRSYVDLAVETTMRRSELVNLTWEAVNFEQRTIYLEDSKTGRRYVPLSSAAIERLKKMRGGSATGRLFDVSPDGATQAIQGACRRAKIPDFRLHDLRHEGTSRLFEKGLTAVEAKSVTGHRTTQMLERYTHISNEHVLKKLDSK